MSNRLMSQEMFDALGASVVTPVFLLEGDFPSGPVRLWTGIGTLGWDDKTWLGGGMLLGVGPIDEGLELRASGTSVTLSGIPSELISLALQDAHYGSDGRIWLACLDQATGQIVTDPLEVFRGRLDVPAIQDDGATAVIELTYENLLVDLFRPGSLRLTDAQQQARFPGDRGLAYVTALAEKNLVWGGKD